MGRFPSDEREFNALSMSLRRMGHILESSYGNIASQLQRQPTRQFFAGPGGSGWQTTVAPNADPLEDPWHQGADPWAAAAPQSNPSFATWQGAAPQAAQQFQMTAAPQEETIDSGTDTDTESSGDEMPDYRECSGMTPAQVDSHLYWQYQRAKSNWRRHMNKPTRRARRFVKRRFGGKGGKSFGK